MKKAVYLLLGILVVVSMLLPPGGKACPCDCPLLQACYNDCKELMPDPITNMACRGGCLIACIHHGTS